MKFAAAVAILAAIVPAIQAGYLREGTPEDRTGMASSTGSKSCPTIADVACGNDDFSTLCAAVTAAGLAETLSDPDAELTVFAPTNAAFAELGQATIDALLADIPALTNILLYHVVDGAVGSSQLEPSGLIPMLNGKDTRSIFHWGGADAIFIKECILIP